MSMRPARPTLRATEDSEVYVVLKANRDEVHLIGTGYYKGEHEAPYGPFNMTPKEWKKICVNNGSESAKFKPFTDTKIYLENGRTVWGKEIFWGPEKNFERFVGDRTVVMVEDFRSKYDKIHDIESLRVA